MNPFFRACLFTCFASSTHAAPKVQHVIITHKIKKPAVVKKFVKESKVDFSRKGDPSNLFNYDDLSDFSLDY